MQTGLLCQTHSTSCPTVPTGSACCCGIFPFSHRLLNLKDLQYLWNTPLNFHQDRQYLDVLRVDLSLLLEYVHECEDVGLFLFLVLTELREIKLDDQFLECLCFVQELEVG